MFSSSPAGAEDPSEEGVKLWVSDDGRYNAQGSGYFTPPWMSNTSLRLKDAFIWSPPGSSTIHLVDGDVEVFNHTHNTEVNVVVEQSQHRVAAQPSDIVMASHRQTEAAFKSLRGNTLLNVSYEQNPIALREGEELAVVLRPTDTPACSVTSGPWSSISGSVGRIRPPAFGGWITFLGGLGLVLWLERRRWRRRTE